MWLVYNAVLHNLDKDYIFRRLNLFFINNKCAKRSSLCTDIVVMVKFGFCASNVKFLTF